MKIKVDDEVLDKIIIARLKSDAKIIKSFLKPMRKKVDAGKDLTPVQYQDYLNMTDDLYHITEVLRYYGVY